MKNTATKIQTRQEYIRSVFGELVGYCPSSNFDPDFRLVDKNVHLGDASERLRAEYASIWVVLGKPDNVVFSCYGGYISVYRVTNSPKYPWNAEYDPWSPIFRKKAKTPHGLR